jgi:type I restriction enzyme S subunit
MLALIEPLVGPAIAMFIASMPIQNWLAKHTRGIAYTGVNIETLKRMPIPLAPIAELRNIVEKVEDLLTIGAATECATDTVYRRASRLRQSILRQAFDGKLVPQDPTDEPAIYPSFAWRGQEPSM